MPLYAFNRSGSPPEDHRSRLGGPCNIPIILLTLCECASERLPCLVEYLKATQPFPRPYPRFTSYLYQVYETIPPLVTSWYIIWAKVIVIVATYRRVVTAFDIHHNFRPCASTLSCSGFVRGLPSIRIYPAGSVGPTRIHLTLSIGYEFL